MVHLGGQKIDIDFNVIIGTVVPLIRFLISEKNNIINRGYFYILEGHMLIAHW